MKKEIPIVPITVINRLLPDLSPLHKWMHGQAKNWIRELVNMIGESKQMQEILARKLGDPGWINPEIQFIYEEVFGQIIEKEKILWTAKNDKTEDGKEIDRNERFWKNLRNVVCVFLDEDSYYVLRAFYAIDIILMNPEKFNIENHKRKAYWDWEAYRAQLLEWARERKMEKEGWKIHAEKKEKVIEEKIILEGEKNGN